MLHDDAGDIAVRYITQPMHNCGSLIKRHQIVRDDQYSRRYSVNIKEGAISEEIPYFVSLLG